MRSMCYHMRRREKGSIEYFTVKSVEEKPYQICLVYISEV